MLRARFVRAAFAASFHPALTRTTLPLETEGRVSGAGVQTEGHSSTLPASLPAAAVPRAGCVRRQRGLQCRPRAVFKR